MKKLLIGILVLIPIIILGVVTLVSSIASTAAHIGVESVSIVLNDEYKSDGMITLNLSNVADGTVNMYDYLKVSVLPTRATNSTIEWSIADIRILDQEYETAYNYYNAHIDEANITIVKPPVVLVDEKGNAVDTNTTGKLQVNTYCTFTIKAMAENQKDQVAIKVVGYDVEKLMLSMGKGSIKVGEKVKIETNYTPIDSIITKTEWVSANENLATVDSNGIVTAIKNGTVAITCRAYKYTDPTAFIQSTFNVVIDKALTQLGNVIYTHENSVLLSALNILDYSIIDGITLSGDSLILTKDIGKLQVKGEEVLIKKCSGDDIVIDQASIMAASTGYAVEVSNMKVNLTASYLSSFKNDVIAPVWTSSNENVAVIDSNGVLTTKSNGIVVITASYNGNTTSVELNLQNKVTSMQLITSDTTLKVGLARETVFASEKYENVALNNNKVSNSVDIQINGYPKDATADELKLFYSAYKFEITDGDDYASFDSEYVNRLVFNSDLEGKGKQTIKVKVSAKYPRYQAFSSYTTETVEINAVYGVQISNIDEFIQAGLDQKTYAYKSDNLIVTTNDVMVCSNLEEEARVSSKNTYAMCLSSNFAYPSSMNVRENHPILYGSLYGNNYMISAVRGQLDTTNPLLEVAWSDIIISNIILRANDIGEDGVITSGDEAADLKGHCISMFPIDGEEKVRIRNISIEYSILENARCSCQAESSDFGMKGCVVRNMSNVGLYITYRVRRSDDNIYLLPCNVVMENMIFSNCLGTAFDLDTYLFEVNEDSRYEYNFGETKEESDQYIKDNIVAKGLNGSFTQKGFMDIYNWISTEDVTLVKTDSAQLNDLLKFASSQIIGTDVSLTDFRYRYNGVDYFHLGFMVESLSVDDLANTKTLKETVWMDINLEDERFYPFDVADIKDKTYASILGNMGMVIYAYKNDANLKPSSSYVINEKLIDKLHGVA